MDARFVGRMEIVINKARLTVFFLVIGLLVSVPVVWATPSFHGPTGLITIPTADVVQSGQFNLGVFYYQDELSTVINGAPLPNLELGIGVWNRGRSLGYLNAKYQLVPETRDYPGIAVGGMDLSDSFGRRLYAVASKNLPEFGVRGHLGIQTPGDPLFAGISKVFNTVTISQPGQNSLALQTSLVAELNGDDLNVGLQLRISPNFVLHASYVGLESGLLGITYNGWF